MRLFAWSTHAVDLGRRRMEVWLYTDGHGDTRWRRSRRFRRMRREYLKARAAWLLFLAQKEVNRAMQAAAEKEVTPSS